MGAAASIAVIKILLVEMLRIYKKNQGSKGIRQWSINLITSQNKRFSRLQLVIVTFELNEPTNQNLTKVPNVLKPTNKKRLFLTLETSVINSLMSPPSLKITGLSEI